MYPCFISLDILYRAKASLSLNLKILNWHANQTITKLFININIIFIKINIYC